MRQVKVGESGSATASGGYANTGVHFGDVNLLTGLPVRTRYRYQVERIAPKRLLGREAELAELAQFCSELGSEESYCWWRAAAWSGKSALMSWFVLHPPAGVRVVSFFITSRLSSQDDRAAFVDNVMEQLLSLLGESWPPFLTESTREAHLLGLLADAASACRARGEQFVLVVDGLDEDRGANAGPGWHSIAALLPIQPPAGMRVIVAGRPNPPVPGDIPVGHPLLEGATVKPLAPSPEAQAIRDTMERDLARLLQGSPTEQDLLGLVAAAGGGLSTADLAGLTGLSPWQVDHHLCTVAGRSFDQRPSHYRPGDFPDNYLLGHEGIRATALKMLGKERLAEYRDRLHTWAEHYQRGRWPADTPEFLLRGYFSMLLADSDLQRMVSCAADPARQDRMLDLSGGDAAALAEITTAQDIIARQPSPNLVTMVRLAIHRDHLTDRNSNTPVHLPAVLARLGQITRAESIANSITDPTGRVEALSAMAVAVAQASDQDRATALMDQAEAAVRAIASAGQRSGALVSMVDAAARMGDFDRAQAIANIIANPDQQSRALVSMVDAAAQMGEFDRAQAIANTIANPDQQSRALASLVNTAVRTDDFGRAQAIANTIPNPDQRAAARASTVKAVADTGHIDQARRMARTINDSYWQAAALACVADAVVVDSSDFRLAQDIADTISDSRWRSAVLVSLVHALASAGRLSWAAKLLNWDKKPNKDGAVTAPALRQRATIIAASSEHYLERGKIIIGFGRRPSAADSDDLDRATATGDAGQRAEALAAAAEAAVERGEVATAKAIATSIADTYWRAAALTTVADAAARAGDLDSAAELIYDAQTTADAISDPYWRAEALVVAADAAARAGALDQAQTIAESILDPYWRVAAMAAAATVADSDRAATLIGQARVTATAIVNQSERSAALATVVKAAASSGHLDLAEAIAETIPDPSSQAAALTAAAAIGDRERAGALIGPAKAAAEAIRNSSSRAAALAALAKVAAHLDEPSAATFLLNRAQAITSDATDPYWRTSALANAAEAAACLGDLNRAKAIADSIINPDQRSGTIAAAAEAATDAGDFDQARAIAGIITDLGQRARTLAAVAKAAAGIGKRGVATELINGIQAIAESMVNPGQRAMVLAEVAQAAAGTGDHDLATELIDRAEAITDDIVDAGQRAAALAAVADAALEAGALDRAHATANAIADPDRQIAVLRRLAGHHGFTGRVNVLARVLRLSRWHIPVHELIEMFPEALSAIVTELEDIAKAGEDNSVRRTARA